MKPATATELIDRYLQAVRFWLPKDQHQQDVLAELGDDLRSQVDDKENELGRPLTQAEVAFILKACGNPMVVASRLGPQRHLIGPGIFPVYLFVLKMVLLWILVPAFVFIVGPVNLANSNDWGVAIAATIGQLWSGMFIAAGIITLVFVIIERTAAATPQDSFACKWDPLKLPPVHKHERTKSLLHTVSELAANVFGFVWLLLIAHHPFLILGPASAFLKAAPVWHQVYPAILALSLLTIARLAIAIARPQWTWFPPAAQFLYTVGSLFLINFLLKAGQSVTGNWQPYIVPINPHALNSVRVVAIANASILLCLLFGWIGTCISAAVQAWKLLKLIREPRSNGSQVLPLEVR